MNLCWIICAYLVAVRSVVWTWAVTSARESMTRLMLLLFQERHRCARRFGRWRSPVCRLFSAEVSPICIGVTVETSPAPPHVMCIKSAQPLPPSKHYFVPFCQGGLSSKCNTRSGKNSAFGNDVTQGKHKGAQEEKIGQGRVAVCCYSKIDESLIYHWALEQRQTFPGFKRL